MQKIGIVKVVYYSLFIFICSSCSDLLSEEETPVNISDEFHIDMYQSLDQTDFELILELSASEEFDCTNYKINTTQSTNNDILEITFNDILEPEVCQVGTGVASTEINFSEQEINHKIRFFFTDRIFDEADLTLDSNKIRLDINSNNGIKSHIDELTKIPAFTLTCLFQYNDLDEELVVLDQIDTLSELVQPSVLLDGYYGYFSVDNKNIQAIDNNYKYSLGVHFDFTTLTDEQLQNFEVQLTDIQTLLSNDKIEVTFIRTF